MRSEVEAIGTVVFPPYSGTRWLMMPVLLEDPSTVPEPYRRAIAGLVRLGDTKRGTAYLTVDETTMDAGETQRRPGLHVDGVGGWGGGGGWGKNGMLLASTDGACRAWRQDFTGSPGIEGDCEHLRSQCRADALVRMAPGGVYWCSGEAVHESLPSGGGPRQFLRLSMPSTCPWFEGYTPSPYGVLPTGEVRPRRDQMNYRP